MKKEIKKEKKQSVDDYDYLSNAASAMDCTGLIPSLPQNDEELESYNDIYQFQPHTKRKHCDRQGKSKN